MNSNKGAAEKRGRRSKEEGRCLVAGWRASGLSASEFGRRNDVPEHVLRYWAGRVRSGKTSAIRPADFYVVNAGEPQENGARPETPSREVAKAVVIIVPLRPKGRELAETLRAVFAEVLA